MESHICIQWKASVTQGGDTFQRKIVYVNIYIASGTILIQGLGYREWITLHGYEFLCLIQNSTFSINESPHSHRIRDGAYSTPYDHTLHKGDSHINILDCLVENLDKILRSPILNNCLELFLACHLRCTPHTKALCQMVP